ncbi:MAG TPA: 6-phosphogluconolactonase [Candidatus Limnocylindrales bacterium]|nr:6-phosphogluconolactonase [Candidatus Limnocylindrales bacterium]
MNGARVEILADAAAVADRGAALVADMLAAALRARATAHVALTGGSTAPLLQERLARPPLLEALDWPAVHLWWGDERFVIRDDPASNAGTAMRAPLPPALLHPIPAEEAIRAGRDAHWAARHYAADLVSLLPVDAEGLPVFDLLLLGVGHDGHILSAFPGSPALADDAPVVLAVPAPTHVEPHLPRVTLSARVVGAARSVLVMATGAAKAAVLAEIMGPEREVRRLPAQLALLPRATWLLDAAAAAALPGPRAALGA